MPVSLVEVADLHKHYAVGSRLFNRHLISRALDGVTLSISDGDCFGLVGESGSGKSTLARCILNLITPTSGRVCFDGSPIFNSDAGVNLDHQAMLPFRRDMQIIFQDPAASLDPRMCIGRIVAEGIELHRIAEGEAAKKLAGDYLELCGIKRELYDRLPSEFSGGQKQRIGIARALALKPRFIAADEPLSALDVSVQSQILNLMREARQQFALTFLFISHDLQTVQYFCDHIAVMYLGSLVEVGATADMVNSPRHPYTQALFSSMPRDTPDAPRSRIRLTGEIPSSINAPAGCKFHPRCPHCRPECRETVPAPRIVSPGHLCWCLA
jgi:oligopeptide/dipeptide ABC transporter ATP-binding protein